MESTTTIDERDPLLLEQDEDVRMAVRALGDMRNSKRAPFNPQLASSSSSASTSTTSLGSSSAFAVPSSASSATSTPTSHAPSPSPSQGADTPRGTDPQTDFVSRVSYLPLVNTAMRAYEKGKLNYPVVKFGAQMVESSISTLSRPVMARLPAGTPQRVEEFGCRTLDRIDRYRRPSVDSGNDTATPDSPNDDHHSGKGKGKARAYDNEQDGQTYQDGPPRRRSTTPDHDDDVNMVEGGGDDSSKGRRPRSRNEDVLRGKYDDWDGRSFRNVRIGEDGGARLISRGRTQRQSEKQRVWGMGESAETEGEVRSWVQANMKPLDSRSATPQPKPEEDNRQIQRGNQDEQEERQIVPRSRWQTVGQAMLMEAGGLSAALSEESMRRLKYCLHWLQYATTQIDAQILILRDFIAALQPLPTSTSTSSHAIENGNIPPIDAADMRTLATVRKDLIKTIREVVDVVGKYAGSALPEPARTRVKGFILKLPERWAATAAHSTPSSSSSTLPSNGGEENNGTVAVVAAASGVIGANRRGATGTRRAQARERGNTSSPVASRASSPRRGVHHHHHHGAGPPKMNAGTAVVAAQKVLGLATESLDMMRSVTAVVKDSLDRADAWVGRLRAVGLQRAAGNMDGVAPVEGVPLELAEEEEPTKSQYGGYAPSYRYDNDNDNDNDEAESSYSSVPSTPYGSSSIPSTPYVKSTSVPSTPMPMSYDQLNLGAMNLAGYSSERFEPLPEKGVGGGFVKGSMNRAVAAMDVDVIDGKR